MLDGRLRGWRMSNEEELNRPKESEEHIANEIKSSLTKERIKEFSYRNLAPLYAGEGMKLCGRLIEAKEGSGSQNNERRYELWIENEEGAVAVRGIAKTVVSKSIPVRAKQIVRRVKARQNA
jgi:hypothetical protein